MGKQASHQRRMAARQVFGRPSRRHRMQQHRGALIPAAQAFTVRNKGTRKQLVVGAMDAKEAIEVALAQGLAKSADKLIIV